MSDKFHQEQTYWSRDVSRTLEIGDSTLRKWCRLLESHGYNFLKDDKDRRAFTEHDLIMFRHFKELTQDNRVSLDTASNIVISKFKRDVHTAVHDRPLPAIPTSDLITERYEERYEAIYEKVINLEEQNEELIEMNKKLLECLNNQESFNKTLIDRLEHRLANQEKYIESTLKEMQETQLQLSSAKEEELLSQRQQRITDLITQRRVQSKLEEEAMGLWATKPPEERFKKVGLFRKEEDRDKRQQFVNNYINKHYEERLKQEYDLS